MRQVLHSVTDCYYKVRQVLQSVTVITKWDVKPVKTSSQANLFLILWMYFPRPTEIC